MIDPDKLFEVVQEDVYGRLMGSDLLSTVSILLLRKGVVSSDVDNALKTFNQRSGGKIGACIVVTMPKVDTESPNMPGPRCNIRMTVQVIEQRQINQDATLGTGLSAERLAMRVLQILHQFYPIGITGGAMIADEKNAIEPMNLEGFIGYEVHLSIDGSGGSLQKVALPSVVLSGSLPTVTATLACASNGAAIYYTLDGSYPYAAGTAAHLYSTPLVITTAGTLRVAAFVAGMNPSDVQLKEITL